MDGPSRYYAKKKTFHRFTMKMDLKFLPLVLSGFILHVLRAFHEIHANLELLYVPSELNILRNNACPSQCCVC